MQKSPKPEFSFAEPESPLRQEYERVRAYVRQLQEKYSREEKNRAYSLF